MGRGSHGFSRTTSSPRSFELAGQGRAAPLNSIYVGFVKEVDDKQRMGRIQVWIPELGGEPTDPNSWYICSYASPFAGATNVYDNTEGSDWTNTQRSYGFWFVPPDVNNEVLVCFINGDPGRGIWFACLYQQNMNHMVPGIPGNNTTATIPVVEYNKKQGNVNISSPNRPVFTPLADALKRLGLDQDPVRGVSSSGARRDDPINSVYGILTPGQNQFVLDDNPGQSYIRLRTRTGAQILINDSDGSVYMGGGQGNNWMGMNSGGEMEIYGLGDISIRSQGSINIRADLDLNLEAARNINIKARNDANTNVTTGNSTVVGSNAVISGTDGGYITINGNTDINMTSGNDFFVRSNRDFARTSRRNMYDYSYGNIDVKAAGNLHMTSGSNVSIGTPGNVYVAGEYIHLNGPPAADAIPAPDAREPIEYIQKDNFIQGDGTFKFINRNTILYRLPYHEPYDYHGSNVPGTNDHVEQSVPTGPVTDSYSGKVLPQGATVPDQSTPLNLVGTPKPGMQPGTYTGSGYDANGNPQYTYTGASTDLKAPGTYQISPDGIEFIKRYEGVKNTVYNDVAHLPSIGVGHKLLPAEIQGQYVQVGNDKIPINQALTDDQVNTLLQQDLQPAMTAVRNGVTVQITQPQFDMLTSFTFNVGANAFKNSTLLKVLNQGNFDQATNEFLRWNKAGGQVIEWLTNRRRAEATNFRGNIPKLA